MADLRHDAPTGRWVAMRRRGPSAGSPRGESTTATCPFCAGTRRTPPETLRLGDGPTGWRVRVVPNLYPALERQEVVITSPPTCIRSGSWNATIDLVAEAWPRGRPSWAATAYALLNEGREAGASPAPLALAARLAARARAARRRRRGAARRARGRRARRNDAGCPVASRVPYESSSRRPGRAHALESDLLAPALRLLAGARAAASARPRRSARAAERVAARGSAHWHLELVPRTTKLAGLELGAGVYIDSVAPEDAAVIAGR